MAKNKVAQKKEQPYRFGLSTLYHADCLSWLSQQKTHSLQGVVTDPPYGLLEYSIAEQDKMRIGVGGVWRIPPSFDGCKRSPLPRFTVLKERDLANISVFFKAWARLLHRVLVPGAHVLIASNPLLSFIVAAAVCSENFERRGEIIRLVMTMRGGDRPKNSHKKYADVTVMPRSAWEPWLLFRKPTEGTVSQNLDKWGTGGLRRISQEQPFMDVIKSSPTSSKERKFAPHPSLKPQKFMREVVRAILPLGHGTLCDPFAGSGSTLAAANAVGYKSVGVEKDYRYYLEAAKAIPVLTDLAVATKSSIKNPTGPELHNALFV